jgi:hypothetical protein
MVGRNARRLYYVDKVRSSDLNKTPRNFHFSRPSVYALTDGQWSPTRSAVFFTTKMDGKGRFIIKKRKHLFFSRYIGCLGYIIQTK